MEIHVPVLYASREVTLLLAVLGLSFLLRFILSPVLSLVRRLLQFLGL